jgi:nucleoid-associated protein EbfC
MFDMMKMMGKIKEVQEKMKEAKDQLALIKASAEAGGGMAKATVNGKKQVVSIELDSDLLNPNDREMAQDLAVAAINAAMDKVDVLIAEHMQKATEGLVPNIPGMDLNNMFNA